MLEPQPLGKFVFFLDYDAEGDRRYTNSPGLLPMLGHLRSTGVDVRFVSSEQALFGELEEGCDWVGISSMERMLPRSVPAARRVRTAYPKTVLLLGGGSLESVACSLAADLFDIVMPGECELTLPAVISALAGDPSGEHRAAGIPAEAVKVGDAFPGGALDQDAIARVLNAGFPRSIAGDVVRIPASGLYLRDSERGAVWHRPAPTASAPWSPAPLSDELDALCVVPWDIVEAEQWSVFEFYTQRGCSWGRCRFCSVADRNIRALSPRKVNEVVRAAAARGLRTVSFADDLFIQRTAWNTELLALLEDPVIPGLEFRAQTIANRSVWPHLEQMARVGFRELAFGIETFSPRRTELWLKSFRGETYIAQAKETVVRTAQAGILPEIYLILADPTSTLAEIAWELAECVELLGKVFAETGVLPRASFTLALLPVAGVPVTDRYPYRIRTIPLAHSKIDLPDEFRMPAPVGSFLAEADLVTGDLPYRRENLEAFFGYFDCLEKAASDHESDAPAVEHELRRARTTLTTLCAELDLLAGSLAERMLSGEAKAGADIWSDYRRFGGYIKGVQTLARSLTELSASSRE